MTIPIEAVVVPQRVRFKWLTGDSSLTTYLCKLCNRTANTREDVDHKDDCAAGMAIEVECPTCHTFAHEYTGVYLPIVEGPTLWFCGSECKEQFVEDVGSPYEEMK